MNLDDSPGAAWGEVRFGEDAEEAAGPSAELAGRSCGPFASFFASLPGLQPILHPDRGNIARDFAGLSGPTHAIPHQALRSDFLLFLVQAIWTESSKQAANVSFLPGQVFVSVKGGDVVTGGAPLDLVVEKVQTIQAMFYRTIEFIRDMPLRPRGAPIRDIQESCRPWLFQAAPGSYQFSVAIQEPKQLDFFKEHVRPDLVARQFLEILKATTSEDQQQLETIVPKADYRNVFLRLSRNLAPTGKRFDSIEFRTGTGDPLIALTPDARSVINQTLKKNRPVNAQGSQATEEELVGILRAVDLDKDFLDMAVDGHHFHVVGLGDAMDDVIGPMVNKRVKVIAVREAKGAIRFRNIELDE